MSFELRHIQFSKVIWQFSHATSNEEKVQIGRICFFDSIRFLIVQSRTCHGLMITKPCRKILNSEFSEKIFLWLFVLFVYGTWKVDILSLHYYTHYDINLHSMLSPS